MSGISVVSPLGLFTTLDRSPGPTRLRGRGSHRPSPAAGGARGGPGPVAVRALAMDTREAAALWGELLRCGVTGDPMARIALEPHWYRLPGGAPLSGLLGCEGGSELTRLAAAQLRPRSGSCRSDDPSGEALLAWAAAEPGRLVTPSDLARELGWPGVGGRPPRTECGDGSEGPSWWGPSASGLPGPLLAVGCLTVHDALVDILLGDLGGVLGLEGKLLRQRGVSGRPARAYSGPGPRVSSREGSRALLLWVALVALGRVLSLPAQIVRTAQQLLPYLAQSFPMSREPPERVLAALVWCSLRAALDREEDGATVPSSPPSPQPRRTTSASPSAAATARPASARRRAHPRGRAKPGPATSAHAVDPLGLTTALSAHPLHALLHTLTLDDLARFLGERATADPMFQNLVQEKLMPILLWLTGTVPRRSRHP